MSADGSSSDSGAAGSGDDRSRAKEGRLPAPGMGGSAKFMEDEDDAVFVGDNAWVLLVVVEVDEFAGVDCEANTETVPEDDGAVKEEEDEDEDDDRDTARSKDAAECSSSAGIRSRLEPRGDS